jgi:hypothetical protein
MQKSYLLLRNNQQSGPYTLEEVKQLPLQPKDLIWIIGQSAGWRYPEEIPALQLTIEPQIVNRVFKPEVPTGEGLPISTPVALSKRVYVSMPEMATSASGKKIQPAEDLVQSLSFEQRVEKMQQRVASVGNTTPETHDAVAEIKYSRSLDDIKNEYADWLRNQKSKKKFPVKPSHLGVAVILLLTVAVSFWIAKQFYLTDNAPAFVQNETIIPSDDQQQNTQPTTDSTTSSVPGNRPRLIAKENTVQKNKAFQEEVPTGLAIENTPANPTQPAPAERQAIRDRSSAQPVKVAARAEEQPSVDLAKQLQITADYLPASKQKGIGGLAVTIKNNSANALKVVAVDVIYFTDDLNEIERKTLYFSNVSPGIALTLNAPAHKQAKGAYARLGLISSESGNLFYASNR